MQLNRKRLRQQMRFSLKALLILVTAFAVFFGYSLHRRQRMIHARELLRNAGVYVELPNEPIDWIWQRKATSYSLSFNGGERENREQLELLGSELGLDRST